MKKLKIRLFGAIEVFAPDGNRIQIAGTKQQALLACLGFNAEALISRDSIIGLLWGNRYNEQARQSLRQGVSKLRQALNVGEVDAIITDGDRLGLNPDFVEVDVLEFLKLSREQTPEADRKAIDLLRGPFLDELYVREAAFEEWQTLERTRFNSLAFPIFERLALYYLKNSEQDKALDISKKLISMDSLRETSHRTHMKILAQSGQRATAIKHYNEFSKMLMDELGIEPDAETKQLLEELKQSAPLPVQDEVKKLADDQPQVKEIPDSIKITLTVLPFQSMGDSENLSAFSVALHEDVLTGLTRFRWLDVIAQVAGQSGDHNTAGLRQTALDQGILFAVEGSVRQIGQQVRVTAQLIDLSSGKYVWVKRYDYSSDDLFEVLDEVSTTIAASVESELVSYEGEKARSKSDGPLSAWDCYHLGLATQYEFSTEGNSRAQALFKRAISLDPSFANAYARLSYVMVLSTVYFDADITDGLLEEALELAHKATRLDDQDAVGWFALGRAYLALGDYQRSIEALNVALRLNPGLAQAYCGLGDALAYSGRSDEAMPNFDEAIKLSPQDPHRWAFMMYGAVASIFAGDYEKAIEWATLSTRIPNSHYWANAALVSALGLQGKADEAKAAAKELTALKPDLDCNFVREKLFYIRDEKQIDRYIEGLKVAGIP